MAPSDDNAPESESGAPPKETAAGEQADNINVGGAASEVNGLSISYVLRGKDGDALAKVSLAGHPLLELALNVMDPAARSKLADAIQEAHPGLDRLEIVDAVVKFAEAAIAELWLDPAARKESAPATTSEEKENQRPQKDMLVELGTRNPNVELFHTPGRHQAEPFASIKTGTSRETYPVLSKSFRWWLIGEYHKIVEAAPGAQALHDALNTIAAVALYVGPEHEVHVRVAPRGNSIWIDLADSENRAVLVTARGWFRVAGNHVPIRFVRRRGQTPLPVPMKGGSIHDLQALVNVPDEKMWILLVTVLVSYLWPRGPYVILIINGEQGSAKSTLCRFLRLLVDPNQSVLRRPPRDDRDLMIAASNSWMIVMDNLSGIAPTLSDAICSLATGGGFATRELYTDADEKIFDAMRPVVINGIADISTRPDLLDRSVLLTLPAIPEKDRVDERKLHAQFAKVQPKLLGSLLDALVVALRHRDEVTLPSLPRMADFALLGSAVAPAFGWEQKDFLEAYASNRQDAHSVALESSAVGPAVLDLMQTRQRWEGSAMELLALLQERNPDSPGAKRTDWPKSPRGMREAIARIAPNLRAEGIEVTFPPRASGGKRERRIVLERRDLTRPPPTDLTPQPEAPGRSRDDRQDEDRPAESVRGASETAIRDGRDDGDDHCPTFNSRDGLQPEWPGPSSPPPSNGEVGEQSSQPSLPSRDGLGVPETALSEGRWGDGPGHAASEDRPSPPDDRDSSGGVLDRVLQTFEGIEVPAPGGEFKVPSPTPKVPKGGSPNATPVFEGMDEPEVWQ